MRSSDPGLLVYATIALCHLSETGVLGGVRAATRRTDFRKAVGLGGSSSYPVSCTHVLLSSFVFNTIASRLITTFIAPLSEANAYTSFNKFLVAQQTWRIK
eukprot:scaffold991_cov278-Amphora_coffeaeformis.AAC.1